MAIFTNVVLGSYEYEIEKDHYEEIEGKISVTGDQIVTVKLVSEEEEDMMKNMMKKNHTEINYTEGGIRKRT